MSGGVSGTGSFGHYFPKFAQRSRSSLTWLTSCHALLDKAAQVLGVFRKLHQIVNIHVKSLGDCADRCDGTNLKARFHLADHAF